MWMLTKEEKRNMTTKSLSPLFEQDNNKVYFNYPQILLVINCKIHFICKACCIMRAGVWKLVLVKFRFLIMNLLIMRLTNQW